MHVLAMQVAEGGGQLQQIARTFGVDWTHLIAQIVSFGIVCFVLYRLAYTPILRMLETRREQIASGLANAAKIKAELDRIEGERLDILRRAGEEGKQLIAEARAAAVRVQAEESRKATAAVGEPGTPSESIGNNAEVPAACAAVSGAITPSISPLPKLLPRFETRLAMP